MQHLFIIDPFETLQVGHDSSLALIKAALQKNHLVYICEPKNLTWQEKSLIASAQAVELIDNKLISCENKILNLSQKQKLIVWMRKDPPVNQAYIQVCQLLRLASVPVLNNPNALLSCEEKLLVLEFPELTPETTILQNVNQIKKLVQQKGKLIAKPIGGKAGEGILFLQAEDKNLGSLLEMITERGEKKIILQEYLSSARVGDKRIFVLAGEPLGAVLRVPKQDDHRANMAAGGSVIKTKITPAEKEICALLRPRLLELGLYVVGLDVIGEKLTEINITSPTCLEEIAQLDESDPASQIIDWSKNMFDMG